MAHKNHPDCPYPTKAACERARRIELGQCQETTGKKTPEPCAKWAVTVIDGVAVCGQHANSYAIKADEKRRATARKAELDARIDAYMTRVLTHPSVWSPRPDQVEIGRRILSGERLTVRTRP